MGEGSVVYFHVVSGTVQFFKMDYSKKKKSDQIREENGLRIFSLVFSWPTLFIHSPRGSFS